MDTITVRFSGEEIDAAALDLTLKRLVLNICHLKGEPIVRRPGHVYPECFLVFEANGFGLLELLRYLLKLENELRKLGVQDFEFHALMERNGQINGELTAMEITLLSKLDANFTWSVL